MMKQRDAYMAWQKKSLQTLDQESGDRGKFRTLVGSMLWGEVILK
jgi:hypothetical protein